MREIGSGNKAQGVVSRRFRTVIQQTGKTTTGIQVAPEIIEALGTNKRPPVRVTVGNHSYRTTVAVIGGEYWISLSAENREKAGVAGGDEVDVVIELDNTPREVVLPPDFSSVLDSDAEVKQTFDNLSYSNKRRIVLSIEDAKTAETRQRRIEKAVSMLREGKS